MSFNKNTTSSSVAVLLKPDLRKLDSKYTGGLERMVLTDIFLLQKNNILCSIYSSGYVDELIKSKFPVVRLNSLEIIETFFKKIGFHFFGRFLREFCYCFLFLIRARNERMWFSYVKTGILTIFSPKKTINFFHEKPQLFFFRFFYSRYAQGRYFFCSKFLREDFHKRYDINRKNTYVFYNSIDQKKFNIEVRQEQNVKTIFVFAGAWNEVKGLELLVDAIKMIPKRKTDFQMLIAGSTKLWSINFSEEYLVKYEKRIIEKINLDPRISVVGEISYSMMTSFYNRADYFILPSVWDEPASLALCEAAFCGVPTVYFATGGSPEIMSNSGFDVCVFPHTSIALARELSKLVGKNLSKKERMRVRKSMLEKKILNVNCRERGLMMIIGIIDSFNFDNLYKKVRK